MVFFFGGIYGHADDFNYRFAYEQIQQNGIPLIGKASIGWNYLQLLFIRLGFSFESFRIFIGLVGLSLIGYTVYNLTPKYNFVLVLYFIFPFILDVIQIKNFLATSIFIYAFHFIRKEQKIKPIILFLLAASIHPVTILFLPFLLIRHLSLRKTIRISLYATTILILLTFTDFFKKILLFIADDSIIDRATIYLDKAGFGFLYLWIIQFVFVYLIYKIYQTLKIQFPEKNILLNFVETIVKLNIYTILICFPLVIFDGNFTRIFRDVFILNFVILSYCLYLTKKLQLNFIAMGLLIILVYLFSSLSSEINTATVVNPFFRNNLFVESLKKIF